MKILNKEISANSKPFIIAEMSNNHLRNKELALKMIEVASECGVDAIKIQTYTADSLTIDCDRDDFIIKSPPWKGQSYYKLYEEISMPLDWTESLFQKAKEHNIILFSSPFDEVSVSILEKFDCPLYKVASFEVQDFKLLKAIAKTGKPVILSSGISSFEEIKESVEYLKKYGSSQIAVLHCTSSYPASFEQMNLNALNELKRLNIITGLSDHSLSNIPAITSIAMGGRIIEKHFILDRKLGGPDATFSIEPDELKSLVISCHNTWKALGSAEILTKGSRLGKEHGRSIYVVKDVKEGDTVNSENIRVIRPGFGLPPNNYDLVIGQKFTSDIIRGTALSNKHLTMETNK